MSDIFINFILSVNDTFRKRRLKKFLSTLKVKKNDTILDVGRNPYFWEGSGLEGNVTILNIHLPKIKPESYRWIEGDVCNMDMLETDSFDIVFSNSVI